MGLILKYTKEWIKQPIILLKVLFSKHYLNPLLKINKTLVFQGVHYGNYVTLSNHLLTPSVLSVKLY